MNALKSALETMTSQIESPDDSVMLASCRALMIGYDARWSSSAWRTKEIEQEFHTPIYNPETSRKSRQFTLAGKVDGIVEHDGREYLLEHKTASEEIADPSSPYWRRLVIDAQVSAYALAYWQNGRKLAGTLYDVIRKPTIRPRQLTKAELATVAKDATYCGFEITPEDQARYAAGAVIESPRMFSHRLAQDTLANPDKYFQRRPIPRLDNELAEYAQELWDTAAEIRETRLRKRSYRNPNACMAYNSPCEYLPICSGHEAIDSPSYRYRESIHSELPSVSCGLNVLSNSRMATYRQCRRKHFYRYEVGLERDHDDREALMFGRLFHEGLASWWLCFKECPNECADGSPVSATGGSDADEIFGSVVGRIVG